MHIGRGAWITFVCLFALFVSHLAYAAPGTPSYISISPANKINRTLTVAWGPASGAARYEMYYRPTTSTSWTRAYNSNGYIYTFNGNVGDGSYQARVRACDANNVCGSYKTSGTVTAIYVATPSINSVSAGSSWNAANISWQSGGGTVGYYQLQRSVNGGAWSTIIGSTSSTSHADSGLSSGTVNYRVRACNTAGCTGYSGSVSKSVVQPLVAPSMPSSITVSSRAVTDGSVRVDWGASSGAVSYYLLEITHNGSVWTEKYRGSNRYFDFVDIEDGTYQGRVRACAVSGGSTACSSNQTLAGTVESLRVYAPTGLTVPQSNTSGNYTISWQASAGTATSYNLQQRVAGGSWSTIYSGNGTSHTLADQTNSAYDYQVNACNGVGCSGYSTAQSITVNRPSLPAPEYLNAGLSNIVDQGLNLSWGSVAGASEYVFEASFNNGGYYPQSHDPSATTLVYGNDDLEDGTYNGRVKACGTVSGEYVCSSYTYGPSVEVLKATAPRNIYFVAADSGGLEISWQPSEGAVDYYRIETKTGTVSWGYEGTTDVPMYVDTVTPGETRHYRVKACNSVGCSTASEPVVFDALETVTTPGKPTNLRASPAHTVSGKISALWNAPANEDQVSYYLLEVRTTNSDWVEKYSGMERNIPFDQIEDATFTARVSACATNGTTTQCSDYEYSEEFQSLFVSTPEGLTGPDTSSNGSFSLDWNDSIGTLTHYDVYERLDYGSWTQIGSTASSTYDLSGRDSGTYQYYVRACNSVGCTPSADSQWHTVTVDRPPTPDAPAAISVNPQSTVDRTVEVSWSSVDGAVHYVLEASLDEGAWNVVYEGGDTVAIFDDAEDGTYQARVRACSGTDLELCSEPTALASGFESLYVTVPGNLTLPNTSSTGSYTLTWNASLGTVTRYELEERLNDGEWETVYRGLDLTKSLEGRASGEYSYRVMGCNPVGCSSHSSIESVQVDVGNVVDAPASITGSPSAVVDQDISLNWDPVEGATEYVLEIRHDETSWTPWPHSNPTSLVFSNADLADGVYQARVKACQSSAVGALICSGYTYSAEVDVLLASAPADLTISEEGAAGLEITWSPSEGTADTYVLQRRSIADTAIWSEIYRGEPLVHTDTYVTEGTYEYQVQACNRLGCTQFSQPVQHIVGQGGYIPQPPTPFNAIANLGSLVPYSDIQAMDAVGSVAGSFRINESGAATYSIPFTVAPGTAGVTPELGLVYSSQAGTGVAGYGWSLQGLGAIARCRQTLVQDRTVKPIQWNSEDRFCLDGQRLVAVKGAYGAVGTQYKTEIDSFALITAVGGVNGHPDYWEVARKDGSVSRYGNNGRVKSEIAVMTPGGTSAVFSWSLDDFRDNVGNRIHYEYDNDTDGEQVKNHRLAFIHYAYGNSSSPNAEVALEYEPRPDISESYVAGVQFVSTQRLSNIRTSNGGVMLRSYELAYSEVKKRSLLESVEECNRGGCVPQTTFEWQPVSEGISSQYQSSVKLAGSNRQVLDYKPADINGDGRKDIVWLETDEDRNELKFNLQYALYENGRFAIKNYTSGDGNIHFNDGSTNVVRFHVIDYNADGHTDLVVHNQKLNNWSLYLATFSSTYGWQLSSDAILLPFDQQDAVFADLNGDGLADVHYIDGKILKYRLLELSGSGDVVNPYHFGEERTGSVEFFDEFLGLEPHVYTSSKYFPSDYNGDGIADLVLQHTEAPDAQNCVATLSHLSSSPICIDIERELGVYVSDGQGNYIPYAIDRFNPLETGSGTRKVYLPTDLNNDGLPDLVIRLTSGSRVWFMYQMNTGTGFSAGRDITGIEFSADDIDIDTVQLADLDNDGYIDVVWHDRDQDVIRYWHWNLASGSLVQSATTHSAPSNTNNMFVDVTGDGVVDRVQLIDDNLRLYEGNTAAGLSEGRSVPVVNRIQNGLGAVTEIVYQPMSLSGHYTGVSLNKSSSQSPVDWSNVPAIPAGESCVAESILSNVTDYCHTSSSDYYNALRAPLGADDSLGKLSEVFEFNGPMLLATTVSSSAPTEQSQSAMSRIDYFYAGAKLQAGGRGFLGFEYLVTLDRQTQIKTQTQYRQDWPFVGFPQVTEVFLDTGEVLSSATNSWALQTGGTVLSSLKDSLRVNGTAVVGATVNGLPVRPYIANSEEITHDLASNDILSVVTTTSEYDDYGNPTSIKVVTSDRADSNGSGFATVETSNVYGDNEDAKRLGRLSEAVVAHTRSTFTDTRKSTFTYYTSGTHEGMLKTETIASTDNGDIVTTHAYDNFGNRVQSSVTAGGETRCAVATKQYDETGRFVDASFDCLGRKLSQVVSRNIDGSPLQIRTFLDDHASQSLESAIAYTPGGLKYAEADQTGAWSSSVAVSGDNVCPVGTAYFVHNHQAGGTESGVCYDLLGREIRSGALGFDGLWSVVDTSYDNLGRVATKSEPHYQHTYAGGSQFVYDKLGRVTHTTLADGSTIEVVYNRRNTTTTNALGQSKTEERNVLGELQRVTDAMGGYVSYRYSARGELQGVVNTLGRTVAMYYDDLGRKIRTVDPDKGTWTYEYNGFGELIKQTDAVGNYSTMTYDGLGRMVARQDYLANGGSVTRTGNTVWTYDTAANGLGKLASVMDSDTGYIKAIEYDVLGRPSVTVTSLGPDGIDGDHFEKVTYDQYSRLFQQFDAARESDDFNSNGIQHHYNSFGHKYKLTDALYVGGEPKTIYSEIRQVNERGQVTDRAMANGVVEQSAEYEQNTGRLIAQKANAALSVNSLQDEAYTWDLLGNLMERHALNRGMRESFTYDAMNRLTSSSVGSEIIEVAYDRLGNITHKSDVGDYSYMMTGNRHYLSAAGNTVLSYNSNGSVYRSMNHGDGKFRTITYTAFDKAETIKQGSHLVTFRYGPDRSRYKRIDTHISSNKTKTTLYIGSVEKVTMPNGDQEWKRQLGDVVITQSFDSAGAETGREEHYLLKDHLGSTTTILDSIGTVVEKMSFDPWGKRRSPETWGETSQDEIALYLSSFERSLDVNPYSTRGFTGHEMVDEVDIIHMNGRIYDARIGRFLQADPFVDGVTNTQGYNRYSYVQNNPLNATDPSGYFSLRKWVGAIVGIVGMMICGPCQQVGWQMAALGAASGAAGAIATGGNIFSGAISGAVSFTAGGAVGVGGPISNPFYRAVASGLVSEATGGNFVRGFLGAGFTSLVAPKMMPFFEKAGEIGKVIGAAVIGGTVSVITGGKFGNGAGAAAFQAIIAVSPRVESVHQDLSEGGVGEIGGTYADVSGKELYELAIDEVKRQGIKSYGDMKYEPKYAVGDIDPTIEPILVDTVDEAVAIINESETKGWLNGRTVRYKNGAARTVIYRNASHARSGQIPGYFGPQDISYDPMEGMIHTVAHEISHQRGFDHPKAFFDGHRAVKNYRKAIQ